MQVHLPTEMSFLHNTRYYRLYLHYKRLYVNFQNWRID